MGSQSHPREESPLRFSEDSLRPEPSPYPALQDLFVLLIQLSLTERVRRTSFPSFNELVICIYSLSTRAPGPACVALFPHLCE